MSAHDGIVEALLEDPAILSIPLHVLAGDILARFPVRRQEAYDAIRDALQYAVPMQAVA